MMGSQIRGSKGLPGVSIQMAGVWILMLCGVFIHRPAGAADAEGGNDTDQGFVSSIEKAHGAQAWRSKQAVSADLTIDFGGQRMLEGTMIFDTAVGRSRMELADGTVLVFDGETAWVSPADSSFKDARFHVLTWPYFLAAPMKLRDPGTHLKDTGEMPWRKDKKVDTAKLTFEGGVGDAPDDWYILYRDPQTHRLLGAAYIVTFEKSVDEAEKQPHAISYEQYESVDGVSLPHRWRFWHWDKNKGIHGQPIGKAKLMNVRFVSPKPGTFKKPNNARMAHHPKRAAAGSGE